MVQIDLLSTQREVGMELDLELPRTKLDLLPG
jgi:hypothetical protein